MELRVCHFVPIDPYPVAGHHSEESVPILLTPALQIFVCIDMVLSQSFLQAKQAQLPQLSLLREILQSLHHFVKLVFHNSPLVDHLY